MWYKKLSFHSRFVRQVHPLRSGIGLFGPELDLFRHAKIRRLSYRRQSRLPSGIASKSTSNTTSTFFDTISSSLSRSFYRYTNYRSSTIQSSLPASESPFLQHLPPPTSFSHSLLTRRSSAPPSFHAGFVITSSQRSRANTERLVSMLSSTLQAVLRIQCGQV
jgi:hypothetical protein